MTFEAAYSRERSEQWGEVWPAIKNTVWHGDNVVIHCIKGRHRGAYLAVLCRALLAGETIDGANAHIEARRNTELHKVIRDKGMKKWLHEHSGMPAWVPHILLHRGTLPQTGAALMW